MEGADGDCEEPEGEAVEPEGGEDGEEAEGGDQGWVGEGSGRGDVFREGGELDWGVLVCISKRGGKREWDRGDLTHSGDSKGIWTDGDELQDQQAL